MSSVWGMGGLAHRALPGLEGPPTQVAWQELPAERRVGPAVNIDELLVAAVGMVHAPPRATYGAPLHSAHGALSRSTAYASSHRLGIERGPVGVAERKDARRGNRSGSHAHPPGGFDPRIDGRSVRFAEIEQVGFSELRRPIRQTTIKPALLGCTPPPLNGSRSLDGRAERPAARPLIGGPSRGLSRDQPPHTDRTGSRRGTPAPALRPTPTRPPNGLPSARPIVERSLTNFRT